MKHPVTPPEDLELPKAAIFDLDGTLLDSVDLHALAWHEAMAKFGHDVSFEQARSQIGKGGDKLIPEFLSANEQHADSNLPQREMTLREKRSFSFDMFHSRLALVLINN